MSDHSSASDRDRPTSSPWPILVAVGLAGSEIGIVVDLFPVAVAGLVLFAASLAGILAESNHVGNPWRLATSVGVAFVLGGSLVYALGTGLVTASAVDGLTGLASRGLAIAVAGVVIAVGTPLVRRRYRTTHPPHP